MIGEIVSHYRIIKQLGAGGMGVVYQAEDTRHGRTVALKFLPPELTRDTAAKHRFIEEARAAFGLEHPNICNVLELDETDDGQLYLVMGPVTRGRLSGKSWTRVLYQLRRRRTSPGRSPRDWLARMARALCTGTSSRRTSS